MSDKLVLQGFEVLWVRAGLFCLVAGALYVNFHGVRLPIGGHVDFHYGGVDVAFARLSESDYQKLQGFIDERK